jgi:hypothetical protein
MMMLLTPIVHYHHCQEGYYVMCVALVEALGPGYKFVELFQNLEHWPHPVTLIFFVLAENHGLISSGSLFYKQEDFNNK